MGLPVALMKKFALQVAMFVAMALYLNFFLPDMELNEYTSYFEADQLLKTVKTAVGGFVTQYFAERSDTQAAIKFGLSMYLLLYIMLAPNVPKLVYSDTLFQSLILRRLTCLHKKFWPTLWCPASWLQMPALHALSMIRQAYQDPASVYSRETIKTKDGTLYTLDWYKTKKLDSKSPIMLILTSDVMGSHAYETITLAESMTRTGFRTFVLNQRGYANSDLVSTADGKATLSTISGSSDLADALKNQICKVFKSSSVHLLTVGSACNKALAYLNSQGDKATVESLVCICPALDLQSLQKKSWLRNASELESLKTHVLTKHKDVLKRSGANMEEAFSAKSVAEFHEHVTMRVCGDDPDDSTYGDYLGAHSVRRIGSGVKRPVLLLCSRDDPVYTFKEVMPSSIVKQIKTEHEHVMIAAVKHGGHMGMLEGITAANYGARIAGQYAICVMEVNKELTKMK